MKDLTRKPFTPLSTQIISNTTSENPTKFFTKLLDVSFQNLAEVGTLIKPKTKDINQKRKDSEKRYSSIRKRIYGSNSKMSIDSNMDSKETEEKSWKRRKRKYRDINTWYRKTLRKQSPKTKKRRFIDVDARDEKEENNPLISPLRCKTANLRPVLDYPTVESREASFNNSTDISNSALINEDLGTIFPSFVDEDVPNEKDKSLNESSSSEKENTSAERLTPLDITRSQSPNQSSFRLKKQRLHSAQPSSSVSKKRRMPCLKPHKILTCLPPGYDLPPTRRGRRGKMQRLRAHKILACLPPGC